jgi:UDP-N-acetylmuramoyl-tripeptide--D-alanyl-D-alanine ligase
MTDSLWRWPELCAALGLPERDGPDVRGIGIDSRRIEPGDLFVALTGDPGPRFNPSQRSNRDGHDYIDAALERGAVGILSHDQMVRDCPELKVPDTLDGLWTLGRAGRRRLDCPVVAVTGSSGKTTTKTLLAAALDAFASPGSLNNHLGVPLSLARTPRGARAAVFEIGTNHPGEIGPLSELVSPDVAVLLNVHAAHLENFRDLEELRQEKISIIKGLLGKSTFVVEDSVSLDGVPGELTILRFGSTADADVRFLDLRGSTARYSLNGGEVTAHVPGNSAHRALCLAAVLGVLKALHRPLEPALNLPDSLVPTGRGNRLEAAGITLIDDSYNANPASMSAALTALANESGRRYALIGEMLELGEGSEAAHRALAKQCAGLEGVFCVGPGSRPLAAALGGRSLGWFESPGDELLQALVARLQPGDTVLIKGSNRVFWASGFVDQLRNRLTNL